MSIIYSDSEPFTGSAGAIRCNPHTQYLKHYGNLLYLKFLANHPESTRDERIQAGKEMQIAERKISYWERDPEFRFSVVDNEIQKLKSQWKIAA